MTVKELLDLHEGRLIAIDSSTGLPLFDSEADRDDKIDRYANGTLMAIWPSAKIGNAFSTRIDICIKCYVKHNSWKNSGTKTANEG